MAYAYISVAYIQMIKASTPVVVLVLSFCFGIESPSCRLFGYIVLVSSGVSLSCIAQVDTSTAGTLLQLAALVCEGLRLCLINLLLTSKGLKLSAIANLFYIAPTCFFCLLGPWALFEAPYVLADHAAPMRKTVRHADRPRPRASSCTRPRCAHALAHEMLCARAAAVHHPHRDL